MKNHRAVLCSAIVLVVTLFAPRSLRAQQDVAAGKAASLEIRLADAALSHWSPSDSEWGLGKGVLLQAMDALWYQTADPRYYSSVKQQVDTLITKDGDIAPGLAQKSGPELQLLGRELMSLYASTQDVKYFKAAHNLRDRLNQSAMQQGPTPAAGHSIRDSWMNAASLSAPFNTQYAQETQSAPDFDEIVRQFINTEARLRGVKAAQLQAGDLGFYASSLVDTLDYFPESQPGRTDLLAVLTRVAETMRATQSASSGLWSDAMGGPAAKASADISASAMLVYAIEKSVRLGYLPNRFAAVGRKGFAGLVSAGAWQGLKQAVRSPQELQREEDNMFPPGEGADSAQLRVGSLLLAAGEEAMTRTASEGRGKTVMLDAWFNSQVRTNAAGKTESFHYKWEDKASSGFSFFQHVFQSYGSRTATLSSAPTLENLKKAQIYLIVSPDILSKKPKPHFMQQEDAAAIMAWVKEGGVLVMMENDGNDSEFEHINFLMDKFGIHFNPVDNNQVPGRDFDKGKLLIPAGNAIFSPKKIYMKEISSITPTASARSWMEWEGNCVMAVTKFGRGTVYAVVDPWLYNEYTDGRRIPMDFENYDAAKELAKWLLEQTPRTIQPPARRATR